MSADLTSLPELSCLPRGEGLIRLPFGQDVPFTPRVRAIVDTTAFQRLRRISQLGLASTVYPGATHSRFEHSLGVYHNALRYLNQLGSDPRFRETVDPHLAEMLLCAALLHDIGHWPFCHPIEDLGLAALPSHERFAEHFLQSDELSAALRSHWNVTPSEILEVLSGAADTQPLRLVRSILSGPIDIDKLDYLDRDSLHAGVPYGRNFDKNRLIGSLVLNEQGDGLAVTAKGKTAAELMVFARYVMFSEVYWHHTVRAATAMFARAFHELSDRLDLSAFLRGSDEEATNQLRSAARGTPFAAMTEGSLGPTRQLYKQAAEWGPLHAPDLYAAVARRPYRELVAMTEQLAGSLRSYGVHNLQAADLLIDAPPPGREVEFKIEIYYPKERAYRRLESVSPVTEALARRQFDDAVKRVRVFVAPSRRRELDQIGDLADIVRGVLGVT